MTEKVELKPCPFCGKEPTRRNSVQLLPTKPDDYVYCETETCPIERKPISIPEWNTRAAASAQPATEWVSVADNFPENVRWVKVKIDNPNSERQYTSIARYIRACAPFEWRFTNGEQVERPDFGITVLAWQECERNVISGPMEILFTPKETTV